jgi:catechol 2,3-dioxygenase-like lactoylglutathione lyase family enzyme
MLKQVQPIIPSKDVASLVDFYVQRLGFSLVFIAREHPAYAVIRRDDVELHLQWSDPREWGSGDRPMFRFLVTDLDSLFSEFSTKGVFHPETALRETQWGTREFAFYDSDRNGLTFYLNL